MTDPREYSIQEIEDMHEELASGFEDNVSLETYSALLDLAFPTTK
jgi:hypothetical protein